MAPKRLRVLVADDYPDIVKAVCRLLALDCDVVGSVANGTALLEAAHRLQPDLVVVDANLPGIDGLEACRRITQLHPATRVIVFTAMSDADVGRRALELGAFACVSKFALGDLLSTIKRLSAD